jgi:hypothetical protein
MMKHLGEENITKLESLSDDEYACTYNCVFDKIDIPSFQFERQQRSLKFNLLLEYHL